MALPSTPSMVASVLLSSNSCTIGHLLKSNQQYQIHTQSDKKDSRINFNMASTVQDVCCGPGPCLLEIQKNTVSCSLSSEKQEKRCALCLLSLSATSHRNPQWILFVHIQSPYPCLLYSEETIIYKNIPFVFACTIYIPRKVSYMHLFSWCFSAVCHRYISAYVGTHHFVSMMKYI